MHVRRLDLGAEVVVIPSRDLLIIHPDLGYAEALGAVAGTLPDLHIDAIVALVDQVTPRPKPEPEPARRGGRHLALALVTALAAVFTIGWPPIATAHPIFGDAWVTQMAALGMECQSADDGVTTCLDQHRDVVKVEGFRRKHSALYVMNERGHRTYMRIFNSDHSAARYQEAHPEIEMAGRVVVWS